jgi:acyl carrier protein
MRWNRASVRSELIKVFEQHAQGVPKIDESSHLVADLGIDSLGVMEVIADLEDAFKITIPDEALREVNTIADVASAIEAKLSNEGRLEG